jgi:uncharacterized protein
MGTIYVMEAANLFMGDADPTSSNHLELMELKLPEPTLINQDHMGGGSVMKMGFSMNALEKLEPTFKLAGFNPERLKQFGLNTPYRQIFSVYGVIRDKRSGRAIEAKAIIEAKLAKMTPDAFQRGEMMNHDYALQEVASYSLTVGGSEIFYVDFFTNVYRTDGVDRFADVNSILRVPGAA